MQIIQSYCNWKSIKNERAGITYGYEIRKFLKFVELPIQSIQLDHIIEYQMYLKNNYSDNTQAIAANALRSFFKFCSKRKLSDIDPTEITIPRIEEKIPIYVVQEEFVALCDIARFISPVILLAVRLLWFTGVRVSELCDIETSQIDTIQMSATVKTRKSYKLKTIFWDKETNDLIKGLIDLENKYLFTSNRGKKISCRQVQRWINNLVKKAKLEKHITPHSFRHGATKEWLNDGIDLPAIQSLLGHKSLFSIEKYTKRLDDDTREKGVEAVRRRVMRARYNINTIKVDNSENVIE